MRDADREVRNHPALAQGIILRPIVVPSRLGSRDGNQGVLLRLIVVPSRLESGDGNKGSHYTSSSCETWTDGNPSSSTITRTVIGLQQT